MILWFLACRHAAPVDSAGDDTALDAPIPPAAELFGLEAVVGGTLTGQTGVRTAVTNPLTGLTFALDDAGTTTRYLQASYVLPEGEACLRSTVPDDGDCTDGTLWTSGRIESPGVTAALCVDRSGGDLYFVKAGAQNLEVVDGAPEGDEAYTYLRASRNPKFPAVIAEAVNWTGPCEFDTSTNTLVLSSPAQMALAQLTVGETLDVMKSVPLGFRPGKIGQAGTHLFVVDETHDQLVALDTTTMQKAATWEAPGPILDLAVERDTGVAWLALGALGVARVEVDETGAIEGDSWAVGGTATQLVADPSRGLAWVVVDSTEIVLVQRGEVRASGPLPGTILRLAEPTARGDLTAFYASSTGGDAAFVVLAPVPEVEPATPLHAFVYASLSGPSDGGPSEPCAGPAPSFAADLATVRANAAALAGLGVPVAVGIGDNFAEKAESCGETAIFAELGALGFELGAAVHDHPCYNCTSGGGAGNPDLCTDLDPNFADPLDEAACFPDHPDYCPLGDDACFAGAAAPRIALVSRNVPGGAVFVAGAEGGGAWGWDWIGMVRDLGFELTMAATAQAYPTLGEDDPRALEATPWRADRRTRAWHPGDIAAWDQDSPTSTLLYLPGPPVPANALAEHQRSGLFVADFLPRHPVVEWGADDVDVLWQSLRAAESHRVPGALNTWTLTLPDLGTPGLRNADGNALTVDPDGDGPLPETPVEALLAAFVERANARYAERGALAWSPPSAVR